jgi:hypothetical protein
MTRNLRTTLLGALSLLIVAAAALGLAGSAGAIGHSVTLNRCGYVKAEYGRSAIYPWHLTCAQARAVIIASDDRHAATVNFGPGWDGGAVAINGKFWVCTGNMGMYGCAYPWRPIAVKGQVGYTGPFTKGVMYETCTGPSSTGCPATVPFGQPPS